MAPPKCAGKVSKVALGCTLVAASLYRGGGSARGGSGRRRRKKIRERKNFYGRIGRGKVTVMAGRSGAAEMQNMEDRGPTEMLHNQHDILPMLQAARARPNEAVAVFQRTAWAQ